jgi:sugar/nucleoside kinase (ribokinase family)
MNTTTSDTLDVLSLGETMALLVAQQPGPLAQVHSFEKRIAGADTNVAIGLARLGFKVGWVSRLGADSFGSYVRATLDAEGVDTSQVETDPQRSTGFMLKSRSMDGSDPAIEYHRRGSAASQLGVAHLSARYALRARHVHTTGITPALSPAACELVAHTMQTLRAAGRSVSFDPNLRPSLWTDTATMRTTLNDLARHAHWVLPGIDEARLLTGQNTPADMAAWYLDRGAQAVVIKQGAQGAYFRTASGDQGQVPGVAVPRVVDTVGAGDAFAVGIISAQLEGLPWAHAVQRANWIASRALQVVGDMEGLPTRAELEQHRFS